MSIGDRYIHTLVVKRMSATTGSATPTVGGLDTALTADVAVGATILPLAAVGALTAGDFLRVGDTGETEVREVAIRRSR